MPKYGKHADKENGPSLFSKTTNIRGKLSDLEIGIDVEPEEEILTVGTRLRVAREQRGLSLHEVADILRLRATQIQALEEGDYNKLPGQTFVTGFLRSYANLLNLDAVQMVELYKQEHSDGFRTPSLAFPEPTSEGRMPGVGMMVGTLVLALVFVASWFLYEESGNLEFERVAEIPDHLAEKVQTVLSEQQDDTVSQASQLPTETEQTQNENAALFSGDEPSVTTPGTIGVSETTEVISEDVPDATSPVDEKLTTAVDTSTEPDSALNAGVGDSNNTTTTAEAVLPLPGIQSEEKTDAIDTPENEEVVQEDEAEKVAQVPPPTTTVAVLPQEGKQVNYPQSVIDKTAVSTDEELESPLPRTFGVQNTDARVVLRAREETWVEVKTPDQEPLISRVLKPGDIYMAPNTADVTLTTGNAGGLEIRVDGSEIAALGGNGAILREIPLIADSLLDGSSANQ
jgi:cytoskeleton protein RodZ